MNNLDIKKYLFCAIDFKRMDHSEKILSIIKNHIGGIKLGLEFFISNGPEGVKYLKKLKLPIYCVWGMQKNKLPIKFLKEFNKLKVPFIFVFRKSLGFFIDLST